MENRRNIETDENRKIDDHGKKIKTRINENAILLLLIL